MTNHVHLLAVPQTGDALALHGSGPVRAGLVELAEDYPWPSAVAHVIEHDDADLLDDIPWREEYARERWRDVLRIGLEDEALTERIAGRP